VFTDGLASISVFIEPLMDQKAEKATYSVGAINAYKRVAGKHLLTVLGEVPMATLMRLGDGMELRKK
jgi:sigma E regulatory protein, MucB/RseB